jgi:hypothetical protein
MTRRIVVLEESPGAAQRLARAATAASDMTEAVVVGSIGEAEAARPAVLGYGVVHADAVAASPILRQLPAVVWTQQLSAEPFTRAAAPGGETLAALLAWPTFATAPRTWEALLAFRAVYSPKAATPTAADLLSFGASVVEWQVSSSIELDDIVQQVSRFAEVAAGRQAAKVAEVTYELLMNALYDAPMTADGQYRFAHDRKAVVQLAPQEAVTCRVACDGAMLVVEVVDLFGSLRRSVVYRSIARGIAAARVADVTAALDTSHGGAGLGLHRVFNSAAATVFHVVRRKETRVCACFDLTLAARDLRAMPRSLHFFAKDA